MKFKYKNVANKIAKPVSYASKAAALGLGLSTVGLPVVAGAMAADLGLKYADKKLGQKYGKYKSYRIARNVGTLGTSLYRGNVIGGIKGGIGLYEDIDPNKRRVAKFDKISTDYIMPTLQLAGAANQARGVGKGIQKHIYERELKLKDKNI